jgi:aspartyl-tRNA(Asn)/glutamyl-tRNA(Gln) amidotransferase subunit C
MVKETNEIVDIRHFAALARLELTEEEISEFEKDIQSILKYVELLSELELKDVKPTSHAAVISNVVREDEIGESMAKSQVLENAPEILKGDYIKVPIVLKNQSLDAE